MFKDLLRRVCQQVDGCLGIVIVGMDGIPIEEITLSDLDFEQLGAEFSSLLKNSEHLANRSALGGFQEMTLSTNKARFVLRSITPDYFILLALSEEGNYGRSRYELRKAQAILETEFVI
jgi:predicted regulator of Ras-like GTPase activity (Roadblock/LC7/MglB family)